MLQRCGNLKDRAYPLYGGRGIKVCDRWREFTSFYADMGDPAEGMTLDRKDVNGNYEPGNCRWADHQTQQNNKRSNRYLSFEGETATLTEWARRYGLKMTTVRERLRRGWSIGQALTEKSAGQSPKRDDLRSRRVATLADLLANDPKIWLNNRALSNAGVCCRGHALTDANTYWALNRVGNLKRRCRLCARRQTFRHRHSSITAIPPTTPV